MTFALPFSGTGGPRTTADLWDVLALEPLEDDLFEAGFLLDEQSSLYGGQVAAQALRAAGLTVEAARVPHSLHGYFLRAGDPLRPTTLRVHRDRDGASFSARRVEALQGEQIIFSMAASFHAPRGEDRDEQCVALPAVSGPEAGAPLVLPRLVSFEARTVEQAHPESPWPTRFWSRATVAVGADPLLQACVLTYLSDVSSGIAPFSDQHSGPGASLDHAVWFHRPVRTEEWTLLDLVPQTVSHGRGWYSGTCFDQAGRAVASTTQECLFRPRRW